MFNDDSFDRQDGKLLTNTPQDCRPSPEIRDAVANFIFGASHNAICPLCGTFTLALDHHKWCLGSRYAIDQTGGGLRS